jgi:phospholipid/cholesterol/gamma-HCH transport system substrate-binding protein
VLLALAATAVVLAIAIRGDDGYTVTATFENASQLVGGEVVSMAGEPVGTVKDIGLAADGTAVVTFGVEEPYAPLPRGTTATVRSFSLAGVANREVELTLPASAQSSGVIPDGGELGLADTVSAVDLDALLNTLDDETVADLKRVVSGLEEGFAGVGGEARRGYRYLSPLLSSSRGLINQLTREEAHLDGTLVASARLSGALAKQAPEITSLVDGAAGTLSAVGAERGALAETVAGLPAFMRDFNTTAVNLRATLDDLDPLVVAARPLARELDPFFAELRGASDNLVPVVRRLDSAIRRPGRPNDLIELTRSLPDLGSIAAGPVRRNGELRAGALPAATEAAEGLLPIVSYLRPYTPEFLAWVDDFGHSGITDANGGLGRISANINTFSAATPGLPLPISKPDSPAQQVGLLSVNNRRRCPGTLERDPGDGSIPFTDDGRLDCNTNHKAVGP